MSAFAPGRRSCGCPPTRARPGSRRPVPRSRSKRACTSSWAGSSPERVLRPYAVDAKRGWLLLPDGGPSLGERLSGRDLIDALAAALPQYARLQRALAEHVPALLGLGLADMRPQAMTGRFDEALAAVRARRAGDEPLQAAVEEVAGMRATVSGWCEELAAGPVPASLDHNDLHAQNMLGEPERVRFYDWGDAVLAHPFATMLALGWLPMAEADVIRLRDAYLAEWADLAPRAELVRQLELACRVGKIARALTWERAIAASGPDDVEEDWLKGPAASLASLREDTWLGRA